LPQKVDYKRICEPNPALAQKLHKLRLNPWLRQKFFPQVIRAEDSDL